MAMWFDDSLKGVWLGPITEGIQNAGYHAFRVDDKEHNDDVTAEIIAGIRNSRFVLADFTGHRGGVHYEAGFAAGLGKPVVRTVRDDHKDDLDFDTRQLSHIIWREKCATGGLQSYHRSNRGDDWPRPLANSGSKRPITHGMM